MSIFYKTIYYLCIFLIFFTSECKSDQNRSDYFLPQNSKTYRKLFKIFRRNKSYQFNSKIMSDLGFNLIPVKDKKKIQVGFHSSLKGYIVKFFNDKDQNIAELDHFYKRIKGAELIRNYIIEKNLTDNFKVPKKWIFKVPYIDKPHYLLLVEDMEILNYQLNQKKWRSKNFDEHLLTKLYFVIKDLGLFDSLYINNIPFSKDGKISFVDTEHYRHRKIKYEILSKFLSRKGRQKWEELTKK